MSSDLPNKKYPKKEIKKDVKKSKSKEDMTISTISTKIAFQR